MEATIELLEDLNQIYTNYYSGMDRGIFDTVIRLDPTFKNDVPDERNKLGTYGKWLLTRASKGQLNDCSNDRIISALRNFDEKKKYLNNDESKGVGKEANKGTDINAYKSIPEIESALACIELTDNQRGKIARKKREYADLGEEAIFIGENDDWEIWRPTTFAADSKLGKGSTWCTASSSGDDRGSGVGSGWFYGYTVSKNTEDENLRGFSRYYHYDDNGKLYVFLNKKDSSVKFQARVGDDTREVTDFMDINDRSYDFERFIAENNLASVLKNTELRDVPEVRSSEAFEGVTKIFIENLDDFNNQSFYRQVNVEITNKETGELEPQTIKKETLFGLIKSKQVKSIIFLSSSYDIDVDEKFKNLDELIISGRAKKVNSSSFKDFKCSVIEIPDTVEIIENKAFMNCVNLKELKLPSNLKFIGPDAFREDFTIKLIKNKGQKIQVTKRDAEFIKSHLVNKDVEVTESLELNEKFDSSMPYFIKTVLLNNDEDNVEGRHLPDVLASKFHINLQTCKFITAKSKSEALRYCNERYIGFFALDNKFYGHNTLDECELVVLNFIYDDGEWDNIAGNYHSSARWMSNYKRISDLSAKTIVNKSLGWWFIDKDSPENMNTEIQTQRNTSRYGSINRVDPDDEKAQNRELRYGRRIDKSGYIVDPSVLDHELNQLHRNTYSKTMKNYASRLKQLKKELIHEYSNLDMETTRYKENELISAIDKLNSLINDYRNIVDRVKESTQSGNTKEKKQQGLDAIFLTDRGDVHFFRKNLVDLEKIAKNVCFDVVENLDEEFKNWAGEELYNKIGHKLTSYDYINIMSNETPEKLMEKLNRKNGKGNCK